MIPFLVGERLYLRALTTDDADGAYVTWFNDEVVCAQNAHHIYPYSRQEACEYIASVNSDRKTSIRYITRLTSPLLLAMWTIGIKAMARKRRG